MCSNLLVVFVFILLISDTHTQTKVMTYKNFVCKRSNPGCLSIEACRFTPGKGNLTISLTFLEKIDKLILHLKEWKLQSRKKYVPTFMDLKFNVCDFTSDGNSSSSTIVKEAVKRFNPYFFETMGQMIHSCPYKGKVEFSTLLQTRTFDGANAFLSEIGDYKLEVEFFSGTKLCFSTVSYKKIT